MEIDIVALDDDGGKVLFGECKLAGHKVTRADLQQLREKARQVKWLSGSRQEYFALFSAAAMPAVARADLASSSMIWLICLHSQMPSIQNRRKNDAGASLVPFRIDPA